MRRRTVNADVIVYKGEFEGLVQVRREHFKMVADGLVLLQHGWEWRALVPGEPVTEEDCIRQAPSV